MTDRHILSLAPASGRGEHVVVEVLQNGSQPLDVRLVGCEGENPYVATIKQRNLPKLKHKFKGSDEDWATVVSHFLLQRPVPSNSVILRGVHLVYTLKEDLELSFQQDVQGIRVVLGEIKLPRDDDFEFNPFDWAQVSAKAHLEALQELAHVKSQTSGELDTIAKLNAQLDDFIKAKDEAETAMLQQFMHLLNEKKRKIRDQGRLLAGAQVDRSIATTVQSARKESRKPARSRQSKRKAPAQAAEPDDAPEPDSDQMEMEQAKEEEQDNDEATPDPSDDETDEEEVKTSDILTSGSPAQHTKEEPKSDGKPPPKRELPFGRSATRSQLPVKGPSPPVDEDGDDTEDEEL